MNRLAKTRIVLSSVLLVLAFSIYVSLLADSAIRSLPAVYRIALLTLLAGLIPIFSNALIDLAMKVEFVREIVFGRSYIEGYWLAETRSKTKEDGITLTVPAIFWVDHDEDGNICPDIRRMPAGENDLWTYSNSIQAFIDDRGRYINRAFINDGGVPRELFAWGTFKRFGSQRSPSSYDGHVVTAGREQIWQQSAVKIPREIVDRYHKAYGFVWMERFLAAYAAGDPELAPLGSRLRRTE